MSTGPRLTIGLPVCNGESLLFDGTGDWTYAVFRTGILRQTPLHGTYHGDCYADP
jgi:hypothetical protein